MKSPLSPILIGAVLLTGSAALGQELFREQFNYANGEISAVSGGTWVRSDGTALNISNGAAVINQGDLNANRERASRAIPTPFTTAGNSVAYLSFNALWTSLPLTANGSYFMNLSVNTTASSPFYGRIGADRAGAADGKFRVAVANASWSTANSIEFPQDLSLNVEYEFVVRYDLNTQRTTLWVDPASSASTSVTATDGPAGEQQAIAAINLRQGISSGTGAPGVIRIDDLRLGTTFESVTEEPSPVPEPAGIVFVAAGALGLFALIRRRDANS